MKRECSSSFTSILRPHSFIAVVLNLFFTTPPLSRPTCSLFQAPLAISCKSKVLFDNFIDQTFNVLQRLRAHPWKFVDTPPVKNHCSIEICC